MDSYYEHLRNDSRDNFDRYRRCTILKDKETGESFLSSREIFDIPVTPIDEYHRVHSHESGRLDIVAFTYYSNPLLWWVIAQANNIYDPLTPVPVGEILRIPSIETLYGNNGILL